MRRAWIIAVSIVATLAVAIAFVSVAIVANRDRLGIGDSGTQTHDGRTEPRTSEDADLGTMLIYDVLADGTLDPAAEGLAAEVWDAFTRVATPAFTSEVILTYQVGSSDSSDLLAWVTQDAWSPEYWHLAVNLDGAKDMSYLLTTLIHEYAHILTLDLEQMPPDGECTVEVPSQECWYDDAYLMAFWREFWSGYGDDAPDAALKDDDVTQAFYEAHEEDFVTSYAATNAAEDIAESFMAYVIEPVPDPSRSVVAAKMAFFERYPELAAIRERIRAEFGDMLQPVWDD